MLKSKRSSFSKNKLILFTKKNTKKGDLKHLPTALLKDNSVKNELFPFAIEGQLCNSCCVSDWKENDCYHLETIRNIGHNAFKWCQTTQTTAIHLQNFGLNPAQLNAFCEGIILSNYNFIKYKKPAERKKNFVLKEVQVEGSTMDSKSVSEFNNLMTAVFTARDLINEPLSYLTAKQYSSEMRRLAKKNGFKLTTLNERQIRALKMGGVLAVNKGSVQPATFNIMEWKPPKAKNKKPIVLVGKGVVFDTGGLSLKPTYNSMDFMKADMGGSAIVVGLMSAISSNKLPYHVVGLVPAVENRPGGDAYVPGDVITMMDKTTVEVLNTDAEGRMILADALTYAKRYKPELVMEFSTLTGAAVRMLDKHAALMMGNASDKVKSKIKESGDQSYERLIELPIWKEYEDMMKSDIADLKNVSTGAGALTAGCFLHHFTDYPWLHFDLGGGAFLHTPNTYRPKGGTGAGIRSIYNFLKSY